MQDLILSRWMRWGKIRESNYKDLIRVMDLFRFAWCTAIMRTYLGIVLVDKPNQRQRREDASSPALASCLNVCHFSVHRTS